MLSKSETTLVERKSSPKGISPKDRRISDIISIFMRKEMEEMRKFQAQLKKERSQS